MNKTIAMAVGLALALVASRSHAQTPTPQSIDLRRDQTTGQTRQTPEMWIYEQERSRYEDPRAAVRRKAEQRATARGDRLAAMRWFGQSNARPFVSAMPDCDAYGAGWVSNPLNPYPWRGGGAAPAGIGRSDGSLY